MWHLVHRHRPWLGLGSLSARGSFVVAFLLTQVAVALLAEGLSFDDRFSRRPLIAAWLLVDLLLVAAALATVSTDRARDAWRNLRRGLAATSTGERVLAALASIELGILIAIGWLYLPSNTDSLVYHLARVAHWVQNSSVHPYATHYSAQIDLSPLHEYNVAHLHPLTGTDAFDGYPQLLAAVVCVLGASEIARLLGGDRWVQVATAVLAATVPSMILEATSTQNNDFAAALGVALVIVTLVWRPARRSLPASILVGFAVGAAALAKGTLLAMLGPPGALLLVAAIWADKRSIGGGEMARRVAVGAGAAVLAAAVVAVPFFARNVSVYGTPAGATSKVTISKDLGPRPAVGNVIRSTAANFAVGVPDDTQRHVADVIVRPMQAAFDALGVDPADPRYLLGSDHDAFDIVAPTGRTDNDEDYGANPVHVVLLVSSGLILLVAAARGGEWARRPLLLAVALGTGYVLFTASARWSVYAVRYQVPLLVLWCPLVAIVLGRLRRVFAVAVLGVAVVVAVNPLINSRTRSLTDPAYPFASYLAPYFNSFGTADPAARAAPYEALTEALAQAPCGQLGLASWVLLEYPLWVGLEHNGWSGRFEGVDVVNPSRELVDASFTPCARVRSVREAYVTSDPGTANFRFGELALSVDVGLSDAIVADAPGFPSEVAGVRIRPGQGWRLAGGEPTVEGSAVLYLTADAPRTVVIRIAGGAGAVTAAPDATTPGAEILETATSGNDLDLVVTVDRSTTAIILESTAATAELDELELLDGAPGS